MPSIDKNGTRSLVLLGIFAALVAVMLSISVRLDNVSAGSFRLDEITLCEDLDDNMSPQVPRDVFPGGTKQVCLWFEYGRARDGDQLEILWQFEREDIQRESFRLLHARGTRAFYLLREDGSALLGGEYAVTIFCNSRAKGTIGFTVEPPDESDGDDELGSE